MRVQEMAQQEQFDRWKAELDAATKIMVARIGANPGADVPFLESQQQSASDMAETMKEVMEGISSTYNDMMNMHGQTMERLDGVLSSLTAPKRLVRGPDGRAVGVEIVRPSIQ
jgi:hypothetical protein